MRISETEPLIFYLEEFGYQTQFSLPLIMNNNTSLAECLQTGHLIIQVWHQNSKGNFVFDISYYIHCDIDNTMSDFVVDTWP